jgi:hypothetical protein
VYSVFALNVLAELEALAVPPFATAGEAQVRVAHFSPDAPNVDVYLDGTAVLTDVAYTQVSEYLPVVEGERLIQVAPAGTSPDSAVISETVALEADKAYTLAAVGFVSNIQLIVLLDEPAKPESGKAMMHMHNFSSDMQEMQISFTPTDSATDDGMMIGTLAFSQRMSESIDAGTYDIEVVQAGENTPLLQLSNVVIESETSYNIYLSNTMDNLEIQGDLPTPRTTNTTTLFLPLVVN